MGATLTDPLVGKLVDGRYRVVSRIARGGMATVYLATDRRLDRDVALKVMHPHLADGADGADFISRFRREARAAARLTHPGLVAVFDQGLDGETSYLTMEFIDGTNLRHTLVTEGALEVRHAFAIIESVLDALATAHRSNLVHRDIKPENVLIAEDGRVKVADFGLARAVTEVTSTATGTVFGTVAYLAPEIILTGTCDARTDVYAVGILLFEMLTGSQPHTGDTPIQVAYKHVNTDIPTPSSLVGWLPQEIDELVCALAARAPEDRPTDATAALELVRRTRASLDASDLDRRAEVAPPTTAPVVPSPAEPDDVDDDTAESPGSPSDIPVETALPPVPPPPTTGEQPAVATSPHDAVTQALAVGAAGAASGTTIALPIGVPSNAEDEAAAPAKARQRRRHRILLAFLTFVLLAAVAGGVTVWWTGYGPGAYTNVPTGLAGQEQQAAIDMLTGLDLDHTVTERYDDAIAKGAVVETKPGEGEEIKRGGAVELVVSLGVETFVVPDNLVGMSRDEAAAAIEATGLTVGPDDRVYDDKIPAGQVMKVSHQGGEAIPHYTPVVLTVSDGPAPVTVPQVVNSTREDATTVLKDLGLKVKVKKDFSETVAEGRVVAQSIEPSAQAKRTDTITITVSKGRPLVKVPDVRGMDTDAAHAELKKHDLVPEDQFAWGGFLGKVRFQSVDPGVKVPKGTSVSLTIF